MLQQTTQSTNQTQPKVATTNTGDREELSKIERQSKLSIGIWHRFGNLPVQVDAVPAIIQPKLTINHPDDPFEQEADRMAEQVMRMPESNPSGDPISLLSNQVIQPKCTTCGGELKEEQEDTGETLMHRAIPQTIQRKCAACEATKDEENQTLMRKAAGIGGYEASPSLNRQLSRSKGSGAPLPESTRSVMENAFQTDFSRVRVHTDKQAADMSRGIQARAFTHGRDIYFGHGEYAPNSGDGKRLLAHELTHVLQQSANSTLHTIQRLPLTQQELDTATTFNQARYVYTAPNPSQVTAYQEILNLLNQVAQNATLFQAAQAEALVGNAFSRLVNAVQEVLYPGNDAAHDGRLGPDTLRDVMRHAQIASTPAGIGGNTTFIPESQQTAPYSQFQNARIGDFRVSGGFMEPHGHSQKPATRAIFAEEFDIHSAMEYNSTNVTIGNLLSIITNLHTIVQDTALRDAAIAENSPGGQAFARLVYAGQIQLVPDAANLDGKFGTGTNTLLTARIQQLNTARTSTNPLISNADPFVRQLAPITEMFESREYTRYFDSVGIATIGVGFNLQRPGAQQQIQAVGANYTQIMAGTQQLTDNQIDILFYNDLQTLGLTVARAVVNNFDNLPLIARLVLADMAFNLGQQRFSNFTDAIAAFQRNDFYAAADEMVDSNWFRQVGRRGEHHVRAIRFLASTTTQDDRIQNLPASDRNLGFDYVIENDPSNRVRAWYGGLVISSGIEGGYGNRVVIETDIRYRYQGQDYIVSTGYAHNSQNFVQRGELVQAGDLIAEMGGTGVGGVQSYSPHVDLRIWITVNGNRVDISPNQLERQIGGNVQQAPAQPQNATGATQTDATQTQTGQDAGTQTDATQTQTGQDAGTQTDATQTQTGQDAGTQTGTTQTGQISQQANQTRLLGTVNAQRGLWILANTQYAYSDHRRQTVHLLQNGEQVSILNTPDREWHNVAYDNNGVQIIGFVPQQYIQIFPAGEVTAEQGLWILANTQYAYSDSRRQTVHLLPNGELVIIMESVRGDWYRISYLNGSNLISGYVPQQYIQLSGN